MFAIVITIEVLAFGLLMAEAGMLLKGKSFHWMGYLGAALLAASAIIWGKFMAG